MRAARHAAVEIAEQAQVAAARQIRIEARALDEAGHAVERARAVDQRITPEEPRVALRRADQPEQHPQRGRLAGAVRPEVAEDVASIDRQVDVVDGDDVAIALDQPSRFEGRRVAHLSERAADSAAEVGIDPASTYETPPRSQVSTVPSCVASSCAVTPSRAIDGSASSIPRLARLRGVRLALDDDDRPEALSVDHEHRPGIGWADEPRRPDAAIRPGVSGATTGNGAAACTAASPVTGALVLPPAVPPPACEERSTIVAPAGGETAMSESGTEPKEMSVACSASTGDDEPWAYTAIFSGVAVRHVPGELGGAEQPAVVARRDRHGVGLLARDIRRLGTRDGPVLAELGEERGDLVERRRRVSGGAGAPLLLRQVGRVRRVRACVVDRHLRVGPDDLGITGIRLELQAAAVRVRPETAGRAGHQRRAGLPGQRARGEQLVREGDPRRHACRLRRAERVVNRLGERLRRRRRAAAAAGGDGDDAGDEHDDDRGEQSDQAGRWQCAEDPHGNPFSSSSPE